jgi:hypothetical protein
MSASEVPSGVDQHLARPHARRHRVGAHAHFLAFEVLRRVDAGVRTHEQAAMMEAAHDEHRQRDKGCAIGAGDDIGGRGQFADIEFDVAHHAAERADLRLNRHEFRVHALDGNGAVADRRRMRMLGDGNFEPHFLSQLHLLA